MRERDVSEKIREKNNVIVMTSLKILRRVKHNIYFGKEPLKSRLLKCQDYKHGTHRMS